MYWATVYGWSYGFYSCSDWVSEWATRMEQFQDPEEAQRKVQVIVTLVQEGAKASKINRCQCERLANMYCKICAYFRELVMLDDPKHVLLLPLLGEIMRILERGKDLVLQYSSAQWFELAVTWGDNQEAFNEIHLSLETNIETLQKKILLNSTHLQLPSWIHDPTLEAINRESDATVDHDKMLETLAELQKNLPMAIAKLKGTVSWGNNLPLNMQVDRSEIMLGKQIGKGAYGLVHEASWLGCKFAVKIIEASNTIALQHEVGILAQLRHPHIVQLVGFSVDKGKGKGKGRGSMILMELMDGDLRQLIEDRVRSTPQVPPFPHYDTVHVISQIAAGMAYLHKKLVFHGDLKASNVLFNHRGGHIEAKITDFGVSQSVQLTKLSDTIIDIDGYSSGSIYSTTSLTGKVGTTGWRAPEVSGIQVSIAIKYKVGYFGEGACGD
jgi:hypothetical protein